MLCLRGFELYYRWVLLKNYYPLPNITLLLTRNGQSKSCNVTMVTWARPSGGETGGWLTCWASQNHCLDYRNHSHSGTSHMQWILSTWLQQTYSSRLRRFRLQCHKRRKDTSLHDAQKALSQTCFGNISRRKKNRQETYRELFWGDWMFVIN